MNLVLGTGDFSMGVGGGVEIGVGSRKFHENFIQTFYII